MSDYGNDSLVVLPNGIPSGTILNSGGNQGLDTTPAKLSESDRKGSMFNAWDAYLRSLYQFGWANPDALIAHKGYDLLDDMLTLSAYTTPLRILMYATLFRDPVLIPAVATKAQEKNAGDYEEAMYQYDALNYHINNIRDPKTDATTPFRAVLWYYLWMIHNGFSLQEQIWYEREEEPYKGEWAWKDVVYHRNKSVGFDLHEQTLKVQNFRCWSPYRKDGVQVNGKRRVPVEKCIFGMFDPSNGMPHGNGLARKCYKHALSIDRGLRDWKVVIGRAGGWVEILSETTDEKVIVELLLKAEAIQNGAQLVHNSQETYTVHPGQGASADFLASFIKYHTSEMKETMLGQTLTTSMNSKGSYAMAETHSDTQNFFFANLRQLLSQDIGDQMFRRWARYNRGRRYEHLHPHLFMGHWNRDEQLLIARIQDLNIKNGVEYPEFDIHNMREAQGLPALDMTQKTILPLTLVPQQERLNEDLTPEDNKDENQQEYQDTKK